MELPLKAADAATIIAEAPRDRLNISVIVYGRSRVARNA
jgi:hypothetical protein